MPVALWSLSPDIALVQEAVVPSGIEGYDHAGEPLGTPRVMSGIYSRGEPCPWHDNVPEDYVAAMRAFGMPDERV